MNHYSSTQLYLPGTAQHINQITPSFLANNKLNLVPAIFKTNKKIRRVMTISTYYLSTNNTHITLSVFISEVDNYHSLLSKDQIQYTNSSTVTIVTVRKTYLFLTGCSTKNFIKRFLQ